MKLLDLVKDPAFIVEADNRQVAANTALAAMLGYDEHTPFAPSIDQFVFPVISSLALSFEQILQQSAKDQPLDCRLPCLNGSLTLVKLQQVVLPVGATAAHVFHVSCHETKHNLRSNSALVSPYINEILDNIREAIFLAPLSREGVHGNFVYVNKTACERLGYSKEQMLCLNARTINPDANQIKVRTFGRAIQREGETVFEAIHVTAKGIEIPVEVVAKVISIQGTEYVLSVVRDKREYAELNTTESRFARLVEQSWDEIYIFDSQHYRFLQVNMGALNNLGYSSKELMGLKLCDLEPEISEAEFKQRVEPLFEGSQSQIIYETKHRRKNGSIYPVEIRLQLSHGEVPPVFLANVQDITERKKIENRLQFLANYDSLTGLPNRALFLDRLTMAMEQCQRNEKMIALLYLDLDGFKRVNDSRGHLVGDELLKQVANRLETVVRRSDTLARLGGDEFCIIMCNLKKTEDVEIVANNVIKEINRPFLIRGQASLISTSIGISFYPFGDCQDADHLMQKADAAMYVAKSSGKNNVQYFTENIALARRESFSLESDLDRAISRGEFYLVYQPKLNLHKMEITGVEALLRWAHPEKGIVFPLDFIFQLEKSGKIQQVGAWVLKQACLQLAIWKKQGHHLNLSVNVSAVQLENPQFSWIVKQTLDEAGIEPSLLELEVNEAALSELTDKAVTCIREIKKLGVTISLDDFGSGYSSLSHIKRLTVNSLKIDGEFVADCEKNPESVVIVDSIIKLADGLRVHIIAEGIETEYQLNLLKSYGCQEGQGFFFAEPLTVEELENKLEVLSRIAS